MLYFSIICKSNRRSHKWGITKDVYWVNPSFKIGSSPVSLRMDSANAWLSSSSSSSSWFNRLPSSPECRRWAESDKRREDELPMRLPSFVTLSRADSASSRWGASSEPSCPGTDLIHLKDNCLVPRILDSYTKPLQVRPIWVIYVFVTKSNSAM